MAITIKPDLCTGCGACREACPADAIDIKDGKAQVDEPACVNCGACVDECPVDAISLD